MLNDWRGLTFDFRPPLAMLSNGMLSKRGLPVYVRLIEVSLRVYLQRLVGPKKDVLERVHSVSESTESLSVFMCHTITLASTGSDNELGDGGTLALANALTMNASVTTLDLCGMLCIPSHQEAGVLSPNHAPLSTSSLFTFGGP